jgi:hypothetical protein
MVYKGLYFGMALRDTKAGEIAKIMVAGSSLLCNVEAYSDLKDIDKQKEKLDTIKLKKIIL